MNNVWWHELELRELISDTAIFYSYRGGFHLRERYQKYACAICDQFDPREAVKAGFDDDLHLDRFASDAFTTRDFQHVVSTALCKALDTAFPNAFWSVKVGKLPLHLIVPKRILLPQDRGTSNKRYAPFRVHSDKCRECGRFAETTIRYSEVEMLPRTHVMGTWVDDGRLGCPNVGIVVDDFFASQFDVSRWRGLKIKKNCYGANNPVDAEALANRKRQTSKNNSWLRLMEENGMDVDGRPLDKKNRKSK